MTSIDCQSWILVHGFMVIDWSRIIVFLTLKHVAEQGIINNLTIVIKNAINIYSGLIAFDIWEGLITFGACRVSTFWGANIGASVQLCNFHVSYMIDIHCMMHWTNSLCILCWI